MKIGVPCCPLALVNKISTNRKHQCSILDTVIHPSLLLNILTAEHNRLPLPFHKSRVPEQKKNALCGEGSLVCLRDKYTNMRFGKQAEKSVR